MIKKQLVITFRNIKKQKFYSLINVTGLALGMACFILLFLWVLDEVSYDRFHDNADELYRLISKSKTSNTIDFLVMAPNAIGPTLERDYPEIINFARFRGGRPGWPLRYKGKVFVDDKLGTADPSFFEMFTFPFIKGNPKTALNDRYSMVITESMAKKYFGGDEPIGQVIDILGKDFKVSGVIKDIPRNSHIQFDYLFPAINMKEWWRADFNSWKQGRFYTFIQLRKNTPAQAVSQKISGIVKKYLPDVDTEVYLQSLTDVHLRSDFKWDDDNIGRGNITYVYIFGLIGVFILLIACINFMSLATARFANRAKEVGIRKVVGAHRLDMIKQFFVESILFAFIALLFALLILLLFIPVFNSLSSKHLVFITQVLGSIPVLLGLIAITFLTGIISGSYPAFFLSSFQPVQVFSGITDRGMNTGAVLRKFLVILQLVLAVILIVGTSVIYSQLNYIRNMDLGFDKKNLVYFHLPREFGKDPETTRSTLLQNSNILGVTRAQPPIFDAPGTINVKWDGKNPHNKVMMHPVEVDYDYLSTFKGKMLQGRFFSREFPSDRANYVVNEAAVKAMGMGTEAEAMKTVIGKRFWFNGREGRIIGVIKNFHQSPLHHEIGPYVLTFNPAFPLLCARLNANNVQEGIRFLESKWKEYMPGFPFSYKFLDETINSFYNKELTAVKIVGYFTFLSIFIACLGLLGLASFTAEKRTKEIGIRKIFGASAASIFLLLSRKFVKWVIAALLIAYPISWYFMNQWLQDFTYRTSIGVGIFFFTLIITLVIVLLAISRQTIKAARSNPVDSLKYQ